MSERWLPAWGLAALAFGGASLIVPLYVVELGGDAFALGVLFASASFVGVPGALGGGVGGLGGGWLATVGYTVAFAAGGGLVAAGAVVVSLLGWARSSPTASTGVPRQ